jgi:hypothetical protein
MKSLSCCHKVALAWTIDGEGCIDLQPNVKCIATCTCQLRVVVSNTNIEFLKRLQYTTGLGSIEPDGSKKTGQKQSYLWRLNYPEMKEFLEAIQPYLENKWHQCYILLEWLNRGWETPLSEADLQFRRTSLSAIREYNQKGTID